MSVKNLQASNRHSTPSHLHGHTPPTRLNYLAEPFPFCRPLLSFPPCPFSITYRRLLTLLTVSLFDLKVELFGKEMFFLYGNVYKQEVK